MIVFYNVVHSPCAVEREVQAFEKKKRLLLFKSPVLTKCSTTAKTILLPKLYLKKVEHLKAAVQSIRCSTPAEEVQYFVLAAEFISNIVMLIFFLF